MNTNMIVTESSLFSVSFIPVYCLYSPIVTPKLDGPGKFQWLSLLVDIKVRWSQNFDGTGKM